MKLLSNVFRNWSVLCVVFSTLAVSCAPVKPATPDQDSQTKTFEPARIEPVRNREGPEETNDGAPVPESRPAGLTPDPTILHEEQDPKATPAPSSDADLNSFKVVCANKSECPEFVTQLIIRNDDKTLATCTGTLIGAAQVMTNSHCIPESLKAANSNCQNRIVVNFPKTKNLAAESAGCLSVVVASPLQKKLSKDYAIFTLSRAITSRMHVHTSAEGVNDSEVYRIAKVNPPESGRATGTLEVVRCEAIQKTEFLLSFDNPRAKQVYLDDCPVRSGNSGSPVLKSNSNTMVAVLQGNVDIARNDLRPFMREVLIKKKGTGWATNLSCVREVSPEQNDLCVEGNGIRAPISSDVITQAASVQDQAVRTEIARNSGFVGWKITSVEIDVNTDPEGRIDVQTNQLACIQPSGKWTNKFDRAGLLFKSGRSKNGRIELEYAQILWGAKMALTPRLQLTFVPYIQEAARFNISFDLVAGKRDPRRPVVVNDKSVILPDCN